MKSLIVKIISIVAAVTVAGAGAFIAVTKPFSKDEPSKMQTTTKSVSASVKATTKETATQKPTTT
ncbi:MAG: hypothetical protein MJ120_07455, partial [Clostridia bacterium]|nr:hypothetical protein [Clostridia bacterium]